MAAKTITLELPEELIELLSSTEVIREKVRTSLVLELLREAHISQGMAARLLGLTRYDILDLMALQKIE
jgi:hypothetical protein